MTKLESFAELRRAMRDMLTLQNEGSTFPRLARAQGFVDGYMRAMLEAKLASQKEILDVVADERARMNGAATAPIASDAGEDAAFVFVSANV